ncbi:sensor histidine kinase [Paenibacillus sp. YN15]|uniref:cache domain-containing sensor histidine kinase n=1 Tax=Paenibacillus sp. YN15 TaxID=1742774 RepID=UPI0015EC8211|nr:sensor histidine kinase [Paenibacillus sp. YN15]
MLRNSLKWKLTFIFTLLFVGNILILAWSVHNSSTKVIIRDSARFGQLALSQAILNIERYMDYTRQFMYRMGVSGELQRWASTSPGLKGELVSRSLRLEEEFVVPFFGLNDDIVSITIYNASNGNEHHFTKGLFFGLNYSIRDEPWFEAVPVFETTAYYVSLNDRYVDGAGKPAPLHVVSLVKRFGMSGDLYVKIDVRPNLLQQILNDLRLGESGIGFIVDADGRMIAHPDSSRLFEMLDSSYLEPMAEAPAGTFTPKGSNLTVIFDTIPDSNWRSVIQIPSGEIASGIHVVRNAVYSIALFNLAASIPLIWLVSASLTKRLISLKKSMVSTGQGNFHSPITVRGNDEIAVVAQSYNRMLQELEAHVIHLSEARALEQQAVMLSLQMQIDAHFLYNTLEIINAMAYKNKAEDVEVITHNLAGMLRYTVELKDGGTSLAEEVEQLRRYLLIVGYRFGGTVDCFVTVETPALLQAESIKILLQPLAENSILHGGFDEDRLPQLELSIAASVNGSKLLVRMRDNGRGFGPERLLEIRRSLAAEGPQELLERKIGLRNIYKRLVKRWGSGNVELRLDNAAGGGAVVEIGFPFTEAKEGEYAVARTDCG